MGPFGRKHFLDAEDEAWHLATWTWMLRHFGGVARLRESPVVLPNSDFFPPTAATGHARAEHIFACVKKHARMGRWPCTLVAQPQTAPLRVGDFLALKPLTGSPPLGTFRVEEGRTVTITYDPAKIDAPGILVATFAHELAHYRFATIADALPGGHEMHEYATDLMTVFLGFGLFGANGAFQFRQHGDAFSQGWQWSRAGYLRERDWVFALAVFLALRNEPEATLKAGLKPHLYSDLKAAARYLARKPSLLHEQKALMLGDAAQAGSE